MSEKIIHIQPRYTSRTRVPVIHQAFGVTLGGENRITAIKQFLRTDGQALDPLEKPSLKNDMNAALMELYPEEEM